MKTLKDLLQDISDYGKDNGYILEVLNADLDKDLENINIDIKNNKITIEWWDSTIHLKLIIRRINKMGFFKEICVKDNGWLIGKTIKNV